MLSMHSSFYFVACAGWPREGQAFHWRTLKSWQGWPSNDWCMLLLYFAFAVLVAFLWHLCVHSVCLAGVARRHPNSWWWPFSSKWGLMFAIYSYVGFLKVKEKPALTTLVWHCDFVTLAVTFFIKPSKYGNIGCNVLFILHSKGFLSSCSVEF